MLTLRGSHSSALPTALEPRGPPQPDLHRRPQFAQIPPDSTNSVADARTSREGAAPGQPQIAPRCRRARPPRPQGQPVRSPGSTCLQHLRPCTRTKPLTHSVKHKVQNRCPRPPPTPHPPPRARGNREGGSGYADGLNKREMFILFRKHAVVDFTVVVTNHRSEPTTFSSQNVHDLRPTSRN